ncbi:MAG: helix-turn-helix domain-containing protein [Actinomycetota bacterium]
MTSKKWIPDHERPGFVATPDRDQRVDAAFDDMFHEGVSYWINVNRRRRKVTQKQIAETLGITQPGVCQMLKRPATISKLWRLCRAMGGELEVNFVVDGKRYPLLGEPADDAS